jgi:hypothetical protein
MAIRTLGSRYLLDAQIGQGGMGVVWRGRDKVTGSPFAIKLLRSEYAADPDAVTRFVRERTVLMKFRHPAVVTLHDMIVEGDQLALVMDLVGGGDLNAYRQRAGGTLGSAEAARLAAQICDGLAAAHAAGIVHRDLKPANVLLDAGQVKLADFGVARIVGDNSATTTGTVLGTAAYLAPELLTGNDPSPASDVYAFGITLYELLAGRPPFNGHIAAIMHDHLQTAPARLDNVPKAFWELLSSCLAKDPAGRPSAAAMAGKLRGPALLAALGPAVPAGPPALAGPAARAGAAIPGPGPVLAAPQRLAPPQAFAQGPVSLPPVNRPPAEQPPGFASGPLSLPPVNRPPAGQPQGFAPGAVSLPPAKRPSADEATPPGSEGETNALVVPLRPPAGNAVASADSVTIPANAVPDSAAPPAPPAPLTPGPVTPAPVTPGPVTPAPGSVVPGPVSPFPGSPPPAPVIDLSQPWLAAPTQAPTAPAPSAPWQSTIGPAEVPAGPAGPAGLLGGEPAPAPGPQRSQRSRGSQRRGRRRGQLAASPLVVGVAAVVVVALVVGGLALGHIGPFSSGHKKMLADTGPTGITKTASPGANSPASKAGATPKAKRAGKGKKPNSQKPLPAVSSPGKTSSPKPTSSKGSGSGKGTLTASGPNLVDNGDFADGTLSGWDYATENASVNPGSGPGGSNAVELTASPQAGVAETISGLTPGAQYLVTGWAKTPNSKVFIGAMNDDESDSGKVHFTVQSGSWTQGSVIFTLSKSESSAVVFCVEAAGQGLCTNMTFQVMHYSK